MNETEKLFDWKPEVSVGHLGLDGEHRYFIELINRLTLLLASNAGQQEIIELLALLEAETEIHFRHEEEILTDSGYPGIDDHAKRHRNLLGSIAAARHALESNPQDNAKADSKRIEYLRKEMMEHILSEDMNLRPHLGEGEAKR
ncbi:MAG: hypothetical protein EPN26_07890 [Rhodospirillales bacterium]|nr:MAG: hypothetical protein EPN26_07890 [Rhodospirillales bacterium]